MFIKPQIPFSRLLKLRLGNKKTKYEKYQNPDGFDNTLCAVIVRFEFLHNTDPRSIEFDPG